jgi:glycine/D-amino acid oxidase-like deaminating enzyme
VASGDQRAGRDCDGRDDRRQRHGPIEALLPNRPETTVVWGLADVVERLGVTIHEGTTVKAVRSGQIITDGGTVSAEIVVRATEGYTRDLADHRRTIAPFYSMMVATEPLPADVWEEISLTDCPTFGDGRNLIIYGQRTADGRLAVGGLGAPYRFGGSPSRSAGSASTQASAWRRVPTGLKPGPVTRPAGSTG